MKIKDNFTNISPIMSQPISDFPQEVLQEIFKSVKGKDAVRCRLVCSQWLQAIDSLGDKAWKEFCLHDFEECFEAYKKADITWRELYKCLTLWPKLPSAKMSVKNIVCPEMIQFSLIRDRLGITQCEKTETVGTLRRDQRSCKRIVYYDLNTLEKKTETIFDFVFDTYSENDKFIVVIEVSGKLCVIPKSTMEKFFVGTLLNSRSGEDEEYSLFENSVYFKNSDNFICMSKLVNVDGQSTVVTESLCEFTDVIVSMTYVKENHINILASSGGIYCMKQNELKMATMIFKYACNVPLKLKEYGFDWSRKSVYDWIVSFFSGEVRIAERNGTFWSLGDIVIMGTAHRVIKIYHNPYAHAAKLKLYNIKPTHSVYLNKFFKFHAGFQKIHQIDAVEIPNGHKVIVFAADKLIVLEFVHEESKRKANVDFSERYVKRKKTVK